MKKSLSIFLVSMMLLLFPAATAKADSGKLIINKVNTDSQVVEPGAKFKLNFSMKNNTDSTVENVVIKLVGIEGKNSLGGFSPVGSTNEIYCNDLDKGSAEQASIDMISDPTLKSGTYNLIVDLKYNIKWGAAYEDTKVVGIVLNNKPNMMITSVDTNDGTKAGENKSVNVNFVNAGKSVLNEVLVTINANDKKYVKYFGEVDPSDENNFSHDLQLNGNVKGKVEITYKDEMNIQGSVTQDFNINAPQNNTKAQSSKGKGFWDSIASFFKGFFGLGG